MKSTFTFILVFIAVLASMIHINYTHFNFDDYRNEFLLGMFIIIISDFVILAFILFKKMYKRGDSSNLRALIISLI